MQVFERSKLRYVWEFDWLSNENLVQTCSLLYACAFVALIQYTSEMVIMRVAINL